MRALLNLGLVVLGLVIVIAFGVSLAGCNHHDRSKAYRPRRSFQIGHMDVFPAYSWTKSEERLLKDACTQHWNSYTQNFNPTIAGVGRLEIPGRRIRFVTDPYGHVGGGTGRPGFATRSKVVVVAGPKLCVPYLLEFLRHFHEDLDPYHRSVMWIVLEAVRRTLVAAIRATR